MQALAWDFKVSVQNPAGHFWHRRCTYENGHNFTIFATYGGKLGTNKRMWNEVDFCSLKSFTFVGFLLTTASILLYICTLTRHLYTLWEASQLKATRSISNNTALQAGAIALQLRQHNSIENFQAQQHQQSRNQGLGTSGTHESASYSWAKSAFNLSASGGDSGCLADASSRFSFQIPKCFGEDIPSRQNCCELFDPLIPTQNSELEGYKKLIVAGSMKAGTSALYKYLQLDAQATVTTMCYRFQKPTFPKEAHFFTQLALRRDDFQLYEVGFRPLLKRWERRCKECKRKPILADYTPTIMKVPYAVCRVRKLWPNAKFVVILRDPVERSISQYMMGTRYGWTGGRLMSKLIDEEIQYLTQLRCTFQGIDSELRKSAHDCYGCRQNVDEPKQCYYNLHKEDTKKLTEVDGGLKLLSRVVNGMYAPQIANILRYYKPKDLLIVSSEELRSQSAETVRKVLKHVGEDPAEWLGEEPRNKPLKSYHRGDIEAMMVHHELAAGKGRLTKKIVDDIEQTRIRLAKFYYNPNQELYELLRLIGYDSFPRFRSDALVSDTEWQSGW